MKLKYLALMLLAVAMLSCRQATRKGEESAKITLGVMSSMDYLPLAVAQRQGYFTENGIEVKLQKFYSANDRDAALQSGNLDGTILDYTGGAIQRSAGEQIQFVSQCDATFELIAGATSGISSLAGLKGKNIAVSRNTVIDFCTDAALRRAGISEDEVIKSEINRIPLRLEMLRNAKIDATMLPDPFATIARNDANISIISMDALGYKVTGIVFREKIINEKRDAIGKFYSAYNRAIDDLLTKPISEFRDVLTEDLGFPETMIEQVKLPAYTHASPPRLSDLEAAVSWLKNKRLVSDDLDIGSLVHTGLLP